MALRAYNNPQITGPVLSREIIKLAAARAKAVVANILQKRNADAADLLVALSMGEKEGRGGEVKRRAVSHHATMNEISPISNETHEDADVQQHRADIPATLLFGALLEGQANLVRG